MGVIDCLMRYAGMVDPPTARRAGLLSPRFTMREAIDIADHLARVTAERDALRAEVEAMRAVVEAATDVVETDTGLRDLRAALDALRARKVPDHACVTTPDGDCVATGPCMHSPPTKADAYFAQAKEVAAEVDNWPEWKKAGFVRKVGG